MHKIVLLGDSIAKGVVRDNPTTRYRVSSSSFAKNCEKLMDIQIENHAHMGSTVVQGLAVVQRIIPKIADANEVWLLFGGNDSNMSLTNIDDMSQEIRYQPTVDLGEYQQKYSELISCLQNLGLSVFLMSLPPIALRKFLKNVQQTIRTPAGRCRWQKFIHRQPETLTNWHEMYNLSVFKLAHKHQIPVIDITTPFLKEKNCEPYFCDDGIHPNNEGHLLITNAIALVRPELVAAKQLLFNQRAEEIRD